MIEELCKIAWEGTEFRNWILLLEKLNPHFLYNKNRYGQTILYCASRNGHTAFVRHLLQVIHPFLPTP